MPGGYYNSKDDNFVEVGVEGLWWEGTEPDREHTVYGQWMNYDSQIMHVFLVPKSHGYSVRCVKE